MRLTKTRYKGRLKMSLFLGQVLVLVFLFSLEVLSQAHASPSMLCDFESGVNTNGPEGGGTGYFRHASGADVKLPVVSPGANGTSYCVMYVAEPDEVKPQSFYIDNPEARTLIEEAHGANRMSAWIKLPPGYLQGSDRNFHFGTYTRDPLVPSDSAGTHY